MAPRTRKRPPNGSYVDEPDIQENSFNQVFNVDEGEDATYANGDAEYAKSHRSKRVRKNTTRPRKISIHAMEISDQEDDIADLPILVPNDQKHAHKPASIFPASVNLQLPVNLRDANISINLHDILQLDLGGQANVRLGMDGSLTAVIDPEKRKKGFEALPAEIVSRILRHVFVSKNPVNFTKKTGFAHSSQLLRISRVVHDEGTRLLYGENYFFFDRCDNTRGTYRDPVWKEIGYKDVRRFLHDIGENKKKLKYVSFRCVDAQAAQTPYLCLAERKFVNDTVLMECFKLIAENALLEEFAIATTGRQCITDNEYDFLRNLTQIRCHEVRTPRYTDWNRLGRLTDKARLLMLVQRTKPKSRTVARVDHPFW